jgi:hypothetical protein
VSEPPTARASSGLEPTQGLSVALILFAVLLAATLVRQTPPDVKPIDAPASEFSAARAMLILRRLVGDGVPHPIGTEANARVFARVVGELEALGYRPQVQETFACNTWGRCATVRNIMARLSGRESDRAVLLMAHYDSVPYAPGAADGGSGVAVILEIARILKTEPAPRHSIVFLLTDGEEGGLLGASGFVDSHPWMEGIDVVINLEARGSSGPARMFEVGVDSGWIVRRFAESCARPMGNSAAAAVYERMPNDTDFTVFKQAGKTGLNFAFAGDVVHYHTPRDNTDVLDPRSLQHEGDCVLPVVRTLARADLPPPNEGNLVFFDVFGFGVVTWPETWTLPLGLAALLLVAASIVWIRRRGALSGRALLWGLLSWPCVVGAGVVAGLGVGWILTTFSGFGAPWTAYPLPSTVAVWTAAGGGAGLVAATLSTRAGFWGLWAGAWTWPALLGVVTAILIPGASFGLLVPTGVAALAVILSGSVVSPDSVGRREIAALVGLGAAVIFDLTWALGMQEGLGLGASGVVAAPLAMLVTTLGPLLPSGSRGLRRGVLGVGAVGLVVSIGIALVLPPFTEARPRPLNLTFHQDTDQGTARWLVRTNAGDVPDPVRKAAALGGTIDNPFREESRRVRARLRSARGAPEVWLFLPPDVDPASVTIAGKRLPPHSAKLLNWTNGWRPYACLTTPDEGVEIEMVFRGGEPSEAYVLDRSYTLPPAGRALVDARPADAVPQHRGDVWIVTRKVEL